VIAERVEDILAAETKSARRCLEEGEEVGLGRLPIRDVRSNKTGIYFVFNWLLEQMNAQSSEKTLRQDLSQVLKNMGVEDRSVGRGDTRRNVKFLPF